MLTLSERAKLADDLISEDPGITIKEYLEVLADIELVQETTSEQTKNIILSTHDTD